MENCILEPNEIKTAVDFGWGWGGVGIPFEKLLPDGRSKVLGKRRRVTYLRVCRDNDSVEFSILAYLVGRICPVIITKDISNTTMTL